MSSADLNFHIGDKVVYPNHGVGVIEQIGSRSIGTSVEKFYLLNIKATSLKVIVPCNNAPKTLRPPPQAKPLPFREKKMLDRARYLLVSELAMSRNCEETKIEELLALALAKCNLRFPEASEFQA